MEKSRRTSDPTRPPVPMDAAPAHGGKGEHKVPRRGFVVGCLGILGLGTAGVIWVGNEITYLKSSHCDNCDAVATATAQATAKHESAAPPYQTLEVMYNNIQLPDGSTGWIIAPRGSDAQTGTVAKLAVGSWLILAVGNNTRQYGQLGGDVAAVEAKAADDPFYDYTVKGHTGEIMRMQIDADMSVVQPGATCTQPVYLLDPRGSKTPAFRAYVLTDEEYQSGGEALMQQLQADPTLGLGANPDVPDPLPASRTRV